VHDRLISSDERFATEVVPGEQEFSSAQLAFPQLDACPIDLRHIHQVHHVQSSLLAH
jgi:hypothetical protein